jgi:uncharacterized protein DUF4282
MAEAKGFLESLTDFSFREVVGTRFAKLIYAVHLLLGLIVAVALVVSAFQASTSEGLLALLLAVFAFFLWVLYVRLALEVMLAVLSIADDIARLSQSAKAQ